MTIKQIAKEVINDFNLQYPLNIYNFCKNLNIKIYREDIDMDGCLLCHNGKVAIIVNKRNSSREKFSIAHELGHFFIPHHNELMFNCYDVGNSSVITKLENEKEADLFASELLMPEHMISRYSDEISFNQIKYVADIFETSLLSTAIRLIKLTDENVILACLSNNKVKWHIWSDSGFMQLNLRYDFSSFSNHNKIKADWLILNDDIEYVTTEIFKMNETDSLILIKEYYE